MVTPTMMITPPTPSFQSSRSLRSSAEKITPRNGCNGINATARAEPALWIAMNQKRFAMISEPTSA